MAGIGFELQRVLENEKSQFKKLNTALKSMIITSGPWIISIITLILLKFFVNEITNELIFTNFINIIIYSFIFSMILTSPFINVITRYLSDLIYLKKFEKIFPLFLSSAIFILFLCFSFSSIYIFYYTDLKASIVSAASLFSSLGLMWLIMVFVSTLRNYNLVTISFLLGMSISILTIIFFKNETLNDLLEGFTFGVLITIVILIAKLKFDFESKETFDFKFLFLKKYLPLFFSGLAFYLAIWVDKLIYWFFSDKGIELSQGFFFFPEYDYVIFLAYLTIIPTTAYFTIYVETTFHDKQRDYFSSIETKQRLDLIRSYEKELRKSFFKGLISTSIFQFTISAFFIILIQYLLDSSSNISSVPLLRIVVLAVSCQMILNVLIIFLYYFDYQKEVLIISLIYLILNIALTVYYKNFSYDYVGYSFFYSTLISLFIALIIALYKIENINYYTFSKNEI